MWAPEGKTVMRKALHVAWCESKFSPYAANPRSSAWGLFQFLDGEGMNARRQTIRARDWYHNRGWTPWACA